MHDLYGRIHDIICEHIHLNKDAMNVCHSWGFQGFKRYHRVKAKEFNCIEICLENNLFDKYRIKADFTYTHMPYQPTSIKEHLKMFDNKLLQGIKKLGELQKEHFTAVGSLNCQIEDMQKCLTKMYEKFGRWYNRFEMGGWLVHDIFVVDGHMHTKMKEYEGG